MYKGMRDYRHGHRRLRQKAKAGDAAYRRIRYRIDNRDLCLVSYSWALPHKSAPYRCVCRSGVYDVYHQSINVKEEGDDAACLCRSDLTMLFRSCLSASTLEERCLPVDIRLRAYGNLIAKKEEGK